MERRVQNAQAHNEYFSLINCQSNNAGTGDFQIESQPRVPHITAKGSVFSEPLGISGQNLVGQ